MSSHFHVLVLNNLRLQNEGEGAFKAKKKTETKNKNKKRAPFLPPTSSPAETQDFRLTEFRFHGVEVSPLEALSNSSHRGASVLIIEMFFPIRSRKPSLSTRFKSFFLAISLSLKFFFSCAIRFTAQVCLQASLNRSRQRISSRIDSKLWIESIRVP